MEKGNNEKSNPGPKFSSYWIYAIIALFLLGINFYSMSEGTRESIQWDRLEEMIAAGDIDKIEGITNLNQAHIYIKKDKLDKDVYQDAAKSSLGSDRYHYRMEFG